MKLSNPGAKFRLLFAISAAFGCAWAVASDNTRIQGWSEDLDLLLARLSARGVEIRGGIASRGQKDFATLYPALNDQIAGLKKELPDLNDEEIVLRLMRMIAAANVAHNVVRPPANSGFRERLPVAFHWYPDSLAVTQASQTQSDALAARVLKIGDKTPDELLSEVAPYISYENDAWLRLQAADFLRYAPVLRHLGLTDPAGTVSITLQKPAGESFVVKIAPTDTNEPLIGFRDALRIQAALFQTQPGKDYWYEVLPESRALFIQYNACRNSPDRSFADFTREALGAADAQGIARFIVDLRRNSGGNERVIAPLLKGLKDRLSPRVAVLIGPETFSSAVQNAAELKQELKAKLVGEPTGGLPSGYGEVKTLTLPYSKVIVRYTTKNFGRPHGDVLRPDISAPRTLADALHGRDPVLEAALAALN